MNFRKAKKRVKKKWRIKKWPGNLPPRLVDDFLTKMFVALSTAIDRAILFGDPDQHKIPIGLTEDIKMTNNQRTDAIKACPYCKQKPTIRKWGRIYRAECEQYACNNPYAANGRTPEDCAECWNKFVSQIQVDMEREGVKPDDQ